MESIESQLTFDQLRYSRDGEQTSFQLNETLQETLKQTKFQYLTSTQRECIERLLDKEDLAIYARTGSGKTLTMLIPIFNEILNTIDSIPMFNEISDLKINPKNTIPKVNKPYSAIYENDEQNKALKKYITGPCHGRIIQKVQKGYIIEILLEIQPRFFEVFYPFDFGKDNTTLEVGDECIVEVNLEERYEFIQESLDEYYMIVDKFEAKPKSNNSFLMKLLGKEEKSQPMAVLVTPDTALCRQLYDVFKSVRDKICKRRIIINNTFVEYNQLIAIQCPDNEIQSLLQTEHYEDITSESTEVMSEEERKELLNARYNISQDIKREIANGKIFDSISTQEKDPRDVTSSYVKSVPLIARIPLIFIGTEERVFDYFHPKVNVTRDLLGSIYDGNEVRYLFIDEIVKSFYTNKSIQAKKASKYNDWKFCQELTNLGINLNATKEDLKTILGELRTIDWKKKPTIEEIRSRLTDEFSIELLEKLGLAQTRKIVLDIIKSQKERPLKSLKERNERFETENKDRGLSPENMKGWLELILDNSRGDNPFRYPHCTIGILSGRYSDECTKFISQLLTHRPWIYNESVVNYLPEEMHKYQQYCNGQLLKIVTEDNQEINYDHWIRGENPTVQGYIFHLEMFVAQERKLIKGFFETNHRNKVYHEFRCRVSLSKADAYELNGEEYLRIMTVDPKQPLWAFQTYENEDEEFPRSMQLKQMNMKHQTEDFYILQPEKRELYAQDGRQYIGGSIPALFDSNIFTLCQLCGFTRLNKEKKEKCKIIIFFETQEDVQDAMKYIIQKRIAAEKENKVLHVSFYNEFTEYLEKIHDGSARILISSKKYKNGLDLANIKLVIIAFPTTAEDYDQMAGRVERFDNTGLVISLRSETEAKKSREIYAPDGRIVFGSNKVESHWLWSSYNDGNLLSREVAPWKIVKAQKIKEKEDFENFYTKSNNRSIVKILNSIEYKKIFRSKNKERYEEDHGKISPYSGKQMITLSYEEQKKIVTSYDSLDIISRDRFGRPGKIRNFFETVNKEEGNLLPQKLTSFLLRQDIEPLNLIDDLAKMRQINQDVALLLRHGIANVYSKAMDDYEDFRINENKTKADKETLVNHIENFPKVILDEVNQRDANLESKITEEELQEGILNISKHAFDSFQESYNLLKPLADDVRELEWVVENINEKLGVKKQTKESSEYGGKKWKDII